MLHDDMWLCKYFSISTTMNVSWSNLFKYIYLCAPLHIYVHGHSQACKHLFIIHDAYLRAYTIDPNPGKRRMLSIYLVIYRVIVLKDWLILTLSWSPEVAYICFDILYLHAHISSYRKWQDYVYIQCEYKSTKQKIKHLLREENKVKENKIS